MWKLTGFFIAIGLALSLGDDSSAQVNPKTGAATCQVWIYKSFILAGEPDLDLFGEDEFGTIGTLMTSQLFCDRVVRSDRMSKLPGWNGADAARRVAEGLTVKRAVDAKQPILALSFQCPDRGQSEVVLQAVVEVLPHFLNDARQLAWESMLNNHENIRKRAEDRVKKAEEYWFELHRKAAPELANGNVEAKQAALAVRDRELALREHDLNIHIGSLTEMQKKGADPAILRLAVNDWRVRNNLPDQGKEPITVEALIMALQLERDGIRQARTINTEEYKRVQEQLLASAGTFALADQLRTQLEQARTLLGEAAAKTMALDTRREALPIYKVTALGRPE